MKALKKPQSIKVPTPLDKMNLIETYIPLYENDIDVYTAVVKSLSKMINVLKIHHHTEVNQIDLTEISFVICDVKTPLEKTITIFVTVQDGFKRKPYKFTMFRQETAGDKYQTISSRSWSTIFSSLSCIGTDSQDVA